MTAHSDTTTTSIITRFEAFVALEQAWTELFEAADDPLPILRHLSLRLAWRLAERRWESPLIVLVRRNGRLVMAGAFAFGIDRFKPSIHFLKGGLPTQNELLWSDAARAGDDAVALLGALRARLKLPRILRKDYVLEGSPFVAATRRLALPQRLWSTRANYFISTDAFADHATYLTELGRKLKSDHLRRLRRLQDAGSFEFRREQGEAARPALGWLLDTKRQWLVRKNTLAPWLKRRRVDGFLDALLFAPDAPPWSLWTIYLDGRPLAAQLSFEERNSWHFQMVGHDPEAKQFAPGRTVVLLAIEQAFAAGVHRVWMGPTGAEWKEPLVNGSQVLLGMRVRLK